ncbi:MAG: hypothetical protein RLZZ337_1947 [Bacteroidota bacterium]|jgi:hypothetical protein
MNVVFYIKPKSQNKVDNDRTSKRKKGGVGKIQADPICAYF